MVYVMVFSVPFLLSFLTLDLQARLEKTSRDNFVNKSERQQVQHKENIVADNFDEENEIFLKTNDGSKYVPIDLIEGIGDETFESTFVNVNAANSEEATSAWNHVKKDLKEKETLQPPPFTFSSDEVPTSIGFSTMLTDYLVAGTDSPQSGRKVKRSSQDLPPPTITKAEVHPYNQKTGTNLNNNADDSQVNGFRIARSASQGRWVKQPYPVHSGGGNPDQIEDTVSSDNVRAPKVHFVTRKRVDNERDYRSRDLDQDRLLSRERDIDRSRDFVREGSLLDDRNLDKFKETGTTLRDEKSMSREKNFYRNNFYEREPYRPLREKFHEFSPYGDDYFRRPFNYYPSENIYHSSYQPLPSRKRYGRRYERYRQFDFERDTAADKPKKQTRIIYYATLPEVARSPPKVDLRDKFNYRYDSYMENPYFGPGRFREPYVPPKPFFDNEPDRPKPLNSELKFSKDLAVKEPKKAPESRIYSEAERRYADDFERFPSKTM